MKRFTIVWTFTIALLLGTQIAAAQRVALVPQGLLGQDYVAINARFLDVDESAIDDPVGLELRWNTGMGHNIDFFVQGGYAWSETRIQNEDVNLRIMDVKAGVINHFSPGENINPYLGLAGLYQRAELDGFGGGSSVTDNEGGAGLLFGIEIAPVERLYLRLGAEYQNYGGDSGLLLGGSFGIWLTDTTLLSAGYTADVENDTSEITAGLAVAF
jgi:opacity protein-like surface antigen